MKRILYLIAILSIASCSINDIDNYEMPNAKLSGKVVDNETGEMIENGGVNNGTIIQLFEGDSEQPITSYSYPDGRFVNNALFQGNYKLVAVGAFKMIQDTIYLSIGRNTDNVEVKVLPNVRLNASLLSFDGSVAEVKVEYSKVHNDQVLDQLAVTWSTVDNPNIYTSYEGGVKIETVTSLNLTSGEQFFTITGLTSGEKYYIRAAARTNAPGGYYNYSNTITTQ